MDITKKNGVNDLIDVVRKNSDIYKILMGRDFVIPNQLNEILKKYNFEISHFEQSDDCPSVKIKIALGDFGDGGFEIRYMYALYFSKVYKAYKDYFVYDISNKDPDGTEKHILDLRYQPMTKKQYNFHHEVMECLTGLGYLHFSAQEIDEPLPNVKFSDESYHFFCRYPSIDLLFFHNVLDWEPVFC